MFEWCPEILVRYVKAWELFFLPLYLPRCLFIIPFHPKNSSWKWLCNAIGLPKIINSVQEKALHCQHFNALLWGLQMWGMDCFPSLTQVERTILARSPWESSDSVLTETSPHFCALNSTITMQVTKWCTFTILQSHRFSLLLQILVYLSSPVHVT